MNRIDRLTAILTHLQSKRTVKAADLSERFGVSLRTIYRDVRALEESGIPIIGEAGQGYSLLEGYRLPPVMFTREEALSFLLAEKLLENAVDGESKRYFSEALYKVKSVLRSTEKDLLEDFSGRIAVDQLNPELNQEQQPHLQRAIQGISNNVGLELEYTSFVKEESTLRKVEPIGVFYSWEKWYLIAWCQLREDYRTFRLDRCQKIRVLNEKFSPEKHPSLEEYLRRIREEKQLVKIVIRVPDISYKYLKNSRYSHGYVSEHLFEGYREMQFMNSHLEGFARWVLMLGDMIRVQEPAELKERIFELLDEIRSTQEAD